MHPLCADCLAAGRLTPATEVHHVLRHGGDRDRMRASPLRSLCKPCHSRRTERGE